MSSVDIKPIQKIHFAMSASVFLLASVIYYLINFDGMLGAFPEQTENMRTVIPMIIVVCMSAGFYVRKKLLQKARQPRSLDKKISKFRTAHIAEMAFYEFTGFAACLASLLTGTSDFLLVAVAFVGILLFKFPHQKYVTKVLGLKGSEGERLV